jgi:hypothetical protein
MMMMSRIDHQHQTANLRTSLNQTALQLQRKAKPEKQRKKSNNPKI